MCVQVIIWKEVNGTWNKLYECSEHKSSGERERENARTHRHTQTLLTVLKW